MPPKRGRPAKQAAQPAAVAASTPKRRGRPSAASVAAAAVATPISAAKPTKRGRAAKAAIETADAPVEEPKARRGGRATKKTVDDAPAPIPAAETKKRARRSRKEPPPATEPIENLPKRRGRPAQITKEAPATATSPPKRKGRAPKAVEPTTPAASPPKRRGRPAKAAVDLNRVVGSSSRVSKRKTATPTKPAVIAPAAPRLNARIRSKLRTRVAPAPKPEPAPVTQPKKRAGRPPKNAVANSSKKPIERKTKGARVTKSTPTKAAAVKSKTTKPAAVKPATAPAATKPRKRRGYTMIEVPDKHAKHMQNILKELLEQDEAEKEAAEEEAQMADDEEEVREEQTGEALMDGINSETDENNRGSDEDSNIASKLAIAEQLDRDVAGGAQQETAGGDLVLEQVDQETGSSPMMHSDGLRESSERPHTSDVDEAGDRLVFTEEVTMEEVEVIEDIGDTGFDGAYEQEFGFGQEDEEPESMNGVEGQTATAERMQLDQGKRTADVISLDGDGTDDDDEGEGNTTNRFNSLFGESPIAASTPGPLPRASSAVPAAPFMGDAGLSSAMFPSIMG